MFLGIMVALAILGLIVQCKAKRDIEAKKKEKEAKADLERPGQYTRI